MPFPFILPTTSAFSFSSSFSCDSHPSLPLNASTRRALVRDTLKKHKRLAPTAQPANLPSVVSCLESYLPYVLALDLGLRRRSLHGQEMRATVRAPPAIEWRPILSSSDSPSSVPGRESRRVRIADLDHEIAFALSTLAAANTLLARAALHPLYTTTSAPVGTQQRQAAIAAATRHLLDAASMYGYLALRAQSSQQQQQQDQLPPPPPCVDVAPTTIRALRSLALAEATLLAVLKDDPYPAVVAQDRNRNDSEWMYKAPDVPKVRAHLFARLCLAAADHAAQALASAQAGGLKAGDAALRYLEDLRRTGRAKACRFFGIDAELGGQAGAGIAWLRAGLQELGMVSSRVKDASGGGGGSGSGGGLGRLRKEWTERREDRKVEKGAANWGADAGRLEEMRVIEMLEAKWAKQNDTIMSQIIPPTGPLLAQMPSGRDIHAIPTYQPPMLEPAVLEAMRAPPDRSDDAGEQFSSDEETLAEPPGAYPGTWQQGESRSGTPAYY